MIRAMALPRLLEGWCDGCPDIRVTGLSLDSRAVRAGDAFVAVRGARGHGLDYAPQAVAAGCRVILHDGLAPVPTLSVPAVRIDGLGGRLGALGARFYQSPSEELDVVGVTGTNGKTSVTHFLAQAWQREHGAAGLIGTLGHGPLTALKEAGRTTPDALSVQRLLAECRDQGCRQVAMEISSHALTQGRCDAVSLAAGVFTNLSHDHLDYHGDFAGYERAKRRLFSELLPRFAVVNVDDPVGHRWREEFEGRLEIIGYGIDAAAEVQGTVLASDQHGLRFGIDSPWGDAEVQVGLMGRFNVANLLAVATTLALLGMRWERVIDQLELMAGVPGRMQPLGGAPGQPVVIVDYAHTPDALKQVLASLRQHTEGRLWCVFGCGGERDREKRPVMGEVAASMADRILVTSDNPRGEDPARIVAEVMAGVPDDADARAIPDRAEAIRAAVAGSRPGDIVLIAGKGHEEYQEIAGKRLPFSDLGEVRAALEVAA